MNADSWFGEILTAGQKPAICSPSSGNRTQGEQKAGTAESLTQQWFQDSVPTVPTVPTEKQSPRKREENTPKTGDTFTAVGDITAGIVTALTLGQPAPATALPADLVERVNLICQLERWPDTDREEWLAILAGQIDRGEAPARELVVMLDAHLARWHSSDNAHDAEAFEERAAIMEHDAGRSRDEAEQLACQVNDCMGCRHWQGVQTYADPRFKALSAAGVDIKPKSMIMGACARRNRPWRNSNIPADPTYFRWHFIGQCGWEGKA